MRTASVLRTWAGLCAVIAGLAAPAAIGGPTPLTTAEMAAVRGGCGAPECGWPDPDNPCSKLPCKGWFTVCDYCEEFGFHLKYCVYATAGHCRPFWSKGECGPDHINGTCIYGACCMSIWAGGTCPLYRPQTWCE